MAKTLYHRPTSLAEAAANPRYQGKIVVAAGGQVFGTTSEAQAVKLLQRLARKFPDDPPITTVFPKGPVVMMPVSIQKTSQRGGGGA